MEEQLARAAADQNGTGQGSPESPGDRQVVYRSGFSMGIATGGDVTLDRVASLGVAAGGDVSFRDGVALNVKARRDLDFTDSAAGLLAVQGRAEVTGSAALVMAANEVAARGGLIGVLVSRQAHLAEGTRVLLNTRQALALGAAFGAVFALLGWLLRRGGRR